MFIGFLFSYPETFKYHQTQKATMKKRPVVVSKIAPLSGGFMLTSIVGFIISAVYLYPRSATWGFAFVLLFILMFVASLISMTYSPVAPKY